MSDHLVAETSTWPHTTLTTEKHPCHPVGFEPTISAGERPQTYALDRAATGTDQKLLQLRDKFSYQLHWLQLRQQRSIRESLVPTQHSKSS